MLHKEQRKVFQERSQIRTGPFMHTNAIMHTNLLGPLFAGFAGVKKLALGVLFPNAGAGGGALTEVREANEEKDKL